MQTQQSKLDKIKARIKALCEKTVDNGCTEEEALAAFEMAGKLLAEYDLSMDEIYIRDEKCIAETIDSGFCNATAVDLCINAIGTFTNTIMWNSKSGNLKYNIFGKPSDVDMAKYLYELIKRAIDFETYKFKQSDLYIRSKSRKSTSVSFQKGMAIRISNRLKKMAEERKNNSQTTPTGKSLVLLKNQVVKDEFKSLNIELVSSKITPKANDYNGYIAGQASGDRVNLNRPINGEKTLLLK